ncbi:MAG: ATP phosphoribosyltransferase, partial [Candidatus Micrarchaeota archaeon]|nr:ATP phosphoribosyltransferase [Candidatus Micrarchaeota archaeon]
MGKKWELWKLVFFTAQQNRRIAYPSKGRLLADARQLLARVGLLQEPQIGATLQAETFALRAADIPACVAAGAVEYGITGLDLVLESDADVRVCAALPFGFCRLVLAGPPDANASRLEGRRIATSFPRLTRAFLSGKKVRAQIVEFSGSVEQSVRLGLADFVVDLVQTGRTLRENGLEAKQEIMSSSA